MSDIIASQLYATEQGLSNGPAGRADWAVLVIIAVHNHVMHTGDLE